MARSTWEGLTLVYKYSVARDARLSDTAFEQLDLALALRRDLVSIDREFDERRGRVWEMHPRVAEAQEAAALAGRELGDLSDRAAKERAEDRSTVIRKNTAAEIKAAKACYGEAKAHLKTVKAGALAILKPELEAMDRKHRDAEKNARMQLVEQGLFWATANAVLDDHRVARQAVLRARKQGKAAERRMPRWDAPATLSTQVMWGQGKPRRSPQLLASGEGPWRNVVRITPWMPEKTWPKGRGSHRKGMITLRIAGNGSEPLVLPIIMHRPLPDDADITDVQVTRRFVADQMQLSVAITVRLPKPPPKTEGVTVAVRIGWAGIGENYVRVATMALPDGPLPGDVPEQLRPMIRTVDTTTEVLAMAEWRRVLDRTERIRGHRDKNLDDIKTLVVKALEADPVLMIKVTEALQRERLEVNKWRAARRMVRLYQVWPEDHPLKEALNQWRKRDKHLWQFEAHERQQIIARRRYLYRNVAAWLCTFARQIVLSDVEIDKLAVRPAVGIADTPQAQQARANAHWAAPGDLRQAIRHAATRRGIQVIEAGASETEET